MKKIYIFLNIILFLAVVMLFAFHFSYKAPPSEKVLKQSPAKENIKVAAIFKRNKNSLTPSALAFIADNDFFAPSRGADPASLQKSSKNRKSRRNQLELTGIFKMGSMKGAIIVNKASGISANKKQFYRIGETITNTSYSLLNISPEQESVTVGTGSSQFELKLERDDQGSLRRRDKGEAASKALVSLSKPKIAPKPKTSKPKTQPKKMTPVKPKKIKNKNRKTSEELKKLRQDILKKMMNRRKNKKFPSPMQR